MKIANIVLNNFTNDSRVLKTSKSLIKNGYQVKVIAMHDNDLVEHENIDGVEVQRLNLKTRKWPKSKPIQLIKYVEFIYRAIKVSKKSDTIHCNDLNALPIGWLIKTVFNRRVKLVYDSHEYAINDVPYEPKWVIKVKYYLEKFFIRKADRVICVSDSIANEYVKLYKINKPYLVLNAPSYQSIDKRNIFRESLGISADQRIFLYQGGLSTGRGIEILLDTFKSMTENNSACIVFMGYGPLEQEIIEVAAKYSNVHFHKAVAPAVLLDYTCSADFGISTIEDSCLSYRYCLPNKMFEYIMAELPVIVSNLYEMKRLVESNQIGVVAQENSQQGLTDAIAKAVLLDKDQLRENLQKVKKIYNWEAQETVINQVYEGL